MGEASLFTTGGLATDVSVFLVACLVVTLLFTATQLVRIIHHSSSLGKTEKERESKTMEAKELCLCYAGRSGSS